MESVGDGGCGAFFPGSNDQDDGGQAEAEGEKWNDPCGAIEAGVGWGCEDDGSVFLYEALLDQAVAIAAGDCGHQFVAHAVGVGAADVIAFEEDLIAAANAHQLMAEILEARGGIAGADKGEDGEAKRDAVQGAAADLF